MAKIYNKLVRDKIPEIIEKDSERPFVRILDEEEYKKELKKNKRRSRRIVFSGKQSGFNKRNRRCLGSA